MHRREGRGAVLEKVQYAAAYGDAGRGLSDIAGGSRGWMSSSQGGFICITSSCRGGFICITWMVLEMADETREQESLARVVRLLACLLVVYVLHSYASVL